ncbi:MAG: excinuclease ABC subunit B, partial [Acidimicrobiales bacterium]
MICDVCSKEKATVYLTQIVEGKMQKVNLCETCASEKGIDDPTGFALAGLLLGLGSQEQLKT